MFYIFEDVFFFCRGHIINAYPSNDWWCVWHNTKYHPWWFSQTIFGKVLIILKYLYAQNVYVCVYRRDVWYIHIAMWNVYVCIRILYKIIFQKLKLKIPQSCYPSQSYSEEISVCIVLYSFRFVFICYVFGAPSNID